MRPTIITLCLLVVVAKPALAQAGAQRQTPIPDIAAIATDAGRIDGKSAWSLTESPDGRFDAFVAFDDTIHVYDRRTHRTHSLQQSIPHSAELNWSRRGNLISFARVDEGTRVAFPWVIPVDLATGLATGPARQVSMRPMPRFDDAPSFSPDDRFVAFASSTTDSGYVLVAPSNGGHERTLYAAPGRTSRATISGDGKWVYFTATKGAPANPSLLYRVPFIGGAAEPLGRAGFFVGVSADSKRLAWYAEGHPRSGATRSIVIADDHGKPLGIIRDMTSKGWSSKPGVLLVRDVEYPFGTRIVSTTGGPIAKLGAVGLNEAPVAWSPDGKLLLATGGTASAQRWLILKTNGDTVRQIEAPPAVSVTGVHLSPVWSPDARLIAYRARSTDGHDVAPRLMLIDVATGRSRTLAEMPGSRIDAIHWRSDSKAVLLIQSQLDSQMVSEVDLAGGVRKLKTGLPAPRFARLFFATDSTMLRISHDTVALLTPRGGFLRVIQASHRPRIDNIENGITISRDAQTIAIMKDVPGSDTKHFIEIIPLNGGPVRTVNYDLNYSTQSPRFAGDAIVFYGEANGAPANAPHPADLFIISLAGGAPKNLTSMDTMTDIDEVMVSPDGRSVAYQAELSPKNTRIIDLDVSSAGRAKPKGKD
jgi:Tol biopolymer transport system component